MKALLEALLLMQIKKCVCAARVFRRRRDKNCIASELRLLFSLLIFSQEEEEEEEEEKGDEDEEGCCCLQLRMRKMFVFPSLARSMAAISVALRCSFEWSS